MGSSPSELRPKKYRFPGSDEMLSRRALTVSRRWLSTASYETLHVERHDHGVVHVQLNRPDKRNASRSSLRSLQ